MIDPATNRLLGGQQYDANGNNTTKPGWGATLGYNSDNRLVSYETPSSGSEYYAYSPFGRMVYRRKVTSETKEYVVFYGVDGQRVNEYELYLYGGQPKVKSTAPDSVHFLGKRIRPKDLGSSSPKVESWVADRVGSEVAYYSGYELYSTQLDHYPYGEQRNGGERSPTYATYLGNSFTGLDYARMRHYTAAAGRFMTPDPYGGSASLTDSQGWNRYAYVGGDPVNHNDPSGLDPIQQVGQLPLMVTSLDSGTWGWVFSTTVTGEVTGAHVEYRYQDPTLFVAYEGGMLLDGVPVPMPTSLEIRALHPQRNLWEPENVGIGTFRPAFMKECVERKNRELDDARRAYQHLAGQNAIGSVIANALAGALFGAGGGMPYGGWYGAVLGAVFGASGSVLSTLPATVVLRMDWYDRNVDGPSRAKVEWECEKEWTSLMELVGTGSSPLP